jgi:serine/threonine protein kinase
MSAIALEASRTKVGDYLLLEKIGKGGMGAVYRGRHRRTGQIAAIKLVDQKVLGDMKLGMRFARECRVTRTLDHPNLVRVLDCGMEGAKAYLVMEYVDGESLGARIERDGRLTEADALALITQVGRALDFVHKRRLVHRDVKPDNILIAKDGQAKLNDLGLVRELGSDANLTQGADILGTPNFMAPEQFENAQQADARSDLYSLAATLYMAVTGEVPFGAGPRQGLSAVITKKLSNDIAAPCQLAPALSKHVSADILQALRCDPRERPASVLAFLESVNVPVQDKGVDRPPNAAGQGSRGDAERRRAKRFPAQRRTACRPVEREKTELWPGKVVDVSATGLCLQLGRRFEPGAILTLSIRSDQGRSRQLMIQVMWARKHAAQTWRIGGRFDQPLYDFEVAELFDRNHDLAGDAE